MEPHQDVSITPLVIMFVGILLYTAAAVYLVQSRNGAACTPPAHEDEILSFDLAEPPTARVVVHCPIHEVGHSVTRLFNSLCECDASTLPRLPQTTQINPSIPQPKGTGTPGRITELRVNDTRSDRVIEINATVVFRVEEIYDRICLHCGHRRSEDTPDIAVVNDALSFISVTNSSASGNSCSRSPAAPSDRYSLGNRAPSDAAILADTVAVRESTSGSETEEWSKIDSSDEEAETASECERNATNLLSSSEASDASFPTVLHHKPMRIKVTAARAVPWTSDDDDDDDDYDDNASPVPTNTTVSTSHPSSVGERQWSPSGPGDIRKRMSHAMAGIASAFSDPSVQIVSCLSLTSLVAMSAAPASGLLMFTGVTLCLSTIRAEMLNFSIESVANHAGMQYSEYAKLAKDVAAASSMMGVLAMMVMASMAYVI